MKKFFLVVSIMGLLQAQVRNTDIAPFLNSKQIEHITLLDQKILDIKEVNGVKFSEISDLAYNHKTEKLYFVSDEGKLFVFEASFSDKIDSLHALNGVTLVKKKGQKFKHWCHDSEGLTLDNKGELYVSFEGRAKIGRFSENGRMATTYKLPRVLKDPKNYRSRNKSLEALTWHPKYGLLTAAEWPLKHMHKKKQTIYALNGKKWHFRAEAESKSAVVAMEVMDDGNIMVIERSYIDLIHPFIITIKKIYLNRCKNKERICESEILVKMNSHKGWSIDNFEGLARVGKHSYLMVSDDNDNFLQQTLLIYFEVKE
ncbi:MAG: esterase-like activity of phytase family protein [Campylobacterota bacterium]|nr:esterase-like activity of phytase family protein [Campylobacterota bacterium]